VEKILKILNDRIEHDLYERKKILFSNSERIKIIEEILNQGSGRHVFHAISFSKSNHS
jgi:hypothetical protein